MSRNIKKVKYYVYSIKPIKENEKDLKKSRAEREQKEKEKNKNTDENIIYAKRR